MPIIADAITLKRLAIVKQLYQRALVESSSLHSNSRKIMAVIGFDLATETMLKAVASTLEPNKQPSNDFQGLVQQCDLLLAAQQLPVLPDKAKIQNVHTIRNDAQHKARYPNDVDVSDCRTYTRDFLHVISMNVWGIQFDRISLADLIQDSDIRKHLLDSEAALSQGDYKRATEEAAYGLDMAIGMVRRAIVGKDVDMFRNFVTASGSHSMKEDRDATNALGRMQEVVTFLALGMDYGRYLTHKEIAGDVTTMMDEHVVYIGQKSNIDAGEAEFVVAFSIDSIIEIENRVGSLEKPFGKDHWHYY
jgi:hypothetical protein